MRAALYLRVSTADLDTARQERELRAVAAARGYEVVAVFADNGISGSKGRDKRPAFNQLHKDAAQHRFDIVMAWSVDRLGHSLKDLITFLHELLACNVELYLFQQALDTTTPSGRAMFQLLGVFAEFERAMIVERINSGLAKARAHGTKSGKAIGRPRTPKRIREQIRKTYLAGGHGMRAVGKKFGVSLGTVQACLRRDEAFFASAGD
jgi:DNA invertase Pin-like site-specific DNA recombinase